MLKLKFKKIIKSLKSFPRRLAKKSFLFFLVLFFIALSLGSAIFYYYAFLAKTSDKAVQKEKLLKLDIETQKRVEQEWERRDENSEPAEFKEYPDPFNIDQ